MFSMNSLALAEVSFKPGADLRIRHEYWKNIFDQENSTKDNRNFFRFRYRFFGDLKFNENISLSARLVNELKAYTEYYLGDAKQDTRFNFDETVIDNLYLDVKNVLDLPLNIRIGRQDFLGMYGEGFLIMDGNPLVGSRSFYFNAFKASYQVNETNTVDFIYTYNPRTDQMLPIINARKPAQLLNRTNETGYILYWKNKDIENLSIEPYYIYKREDGKNKGAAPFMAEKGYLNTFGTYAKYQKESWTFRGQLAGQIGTFGTQDREAIGGYIFVDKDLDMKFNPKITSGFMYLSGNDPDSSKNEGWNPLFSRWPIMSELYVISYAGESDLGYWTNLRLYNVKAQLDPTEKTKLTLAYNFLQANEKPTTSLGNGRNRGHLPQLRFDYKINKDISTYFLAEYFIPGNFYADTADESLFLRAEVSLRF